MKKSLYSREQKKLQALLRQMRIDRGLCQTALAQKLGCPQSFISKYESGERRLDLIELRQICNAIGITLEEFIHKLEELWNET